MVRLYKKCLKNSISGQGRPKIFGATKNNAPHFIRKYKLKNKDMCGSATRWRSHISGVSHVSVIVLLLI